MTTITAIILILTLTPVLLLLTTVHAINQTPRLLRSLMVWLGFRSRDE